MFVTELLVPLLLIALVIIIIFKVAIPLYEGKPIFEKRKNPKHKKEPEELLKEADHALETSAKLTSLASEKAKKEITESEKKMKTATKIKERAKKRKEKLSKI